MLGLDHYSNAGTLTSTLEQGEWAEYEFMKDYLSFDLDLGKKQLESAVNILNEYIKEDSVFLDIAKGYIRFSTNYINSTEKVKKNWNDVLNKYAETKEKQRIEEIKRQRGAALQAKQRKTELMYGILSIFANALLKSGSTTTSVRTSNTYGGSSVSVGTGTTSSGSDNFSKIAEWENKKADALRRRGDYEDKLRKEPNSSYYKQMVRDMNDMIKLCDDQIQFLRTH